METREKRPLSPITGQEGAPIELNKAANWTQNYRQRHPNDTISHFFGREILNNLLTLEGSKGIRIYYANDTRLNGWQKLCVSLSNFILKVFGNINGEKHLIISAVNELGDDLLPDTNLNLPSQEVNTTFKSYSLTTSNGDQSNFIGDQSYPCPGSTGCPKNVLTSD
ncbi:hypothetical protein ABIC45_003350 [Mucilaginibacter rubeus]|jgi:hypothetical protein|uniref:hypothetical protein n=1 Tax=Mucilaginibacter rubeus TaxID=2027860 RepID=UPI00339398F3